MTKQRAAMQRAVTKTDDDDRGRQLFALLMSSDARQATAAATTPARIVGCMHIYINEKEQNERADHAKAQAEKVTILAEPDELI